MDDTYRMQLKELNDLNWARVEAKLGAFDAGMDAFEAQIKARMDTFEAQIKARMDAFEAQIKARMDAFEARIEGRLDAFEARLEASMDRRIQRLRSELLLWMFGFWTATVVPLIGLMLVLSGSFRN